MSTRESSEISPHSSLDVHDSSEANPVGKIHVQDGDIQTVAFLADGKYIVRGGWGNTIRRWRVEDGKEVGKPMDTGDIIWNIAVSQDGKWIVSGTDRVTVWDAKNHKKVIEFEGHTDWVRSVDISLDGTRIATGSFDHTASVSSLSTGERLLHLLYHNHIVAAAKFSPSERLIATAAWNHDGVRVYNSQDGRLLVDARIKVINGVNQSLAWASDSERLFVLSDDGNINCLDVFTGATLSRWPIHSSNKPSCIALGSNDTFIAASTDSSVSFWDTTTHKQVGSVIEHPSLVECMAISANYDLAIGGGLFITLRSL